MLPIVVVGAGAAGLMAAICAAGRGRPVILIERTRDGGRKILISGGGRCNILPSAIDPARFVTASSPHSLRNILRSWPLDEQRRFFEEEADIALTLEVDTGKFFPVSNSARHVRDSLVSLAKRRGVNVRFDAVVVDFEPGRAGGGWIVRLRNGDSVVASAVIVASGGLSVPSTGSDGLGLDIVRRLGHSIHPTYPALTPLVATPHPQQAPAGVSVTATLDALGSTRTTKARGGFLFTHRGYSGPVVLDISHVVVQSLAAGRPAPIHVSWGGIERRTWEAKLKSNARQVSAVVRDGVPARLAAALLDDAKIDPARRMSELRRQERVSLIERLTHYLLPWTDHEGYRKAEVTGGGVALGEVHPATLESRIHPGLFLCGEMLDAFGPIGGHNFAWAWATGRAAGLGAAQSRRTLER